MAYPPNDAGYPVTAFPLEPFDTSFVLPPKPRKFQSRLWLHMLLLVLTILSTTIAGALHYASFVSEFSTRAVPLSWATLLRGFGVFQVKPRKRGIGRNPRTGKEVRIPPGRTIRFKPGKDLQNIGG